MEVETTTDSPAGPDSEIEAEGEASDEHPASPNEAIAIIASAWFFVMARKYS
jgi:hypothetical protein